MVTPEGTWTSAIGLASMDAPALPSNIYGIGSVTKTITATAIFKLQEAGMLTIDDQVVDWIPDVAKYNFIEPNIRVYQLLQHTSGIYNYTNHENFVDSVFAVNLDRVWEPEELLSNFLNLSLFEPGTNWSYSNTNYILLGMIVEAASGMPYHEYVRTAILEPIGLESMALFPQENRTDDHAHIFVDFGNDGIMDDVDAAGVTYESIFSSAWAAGAYTSTSADITTFMRELMRGNILSDSSMESMLAPFPLGNIGYGMGVIVFFDPEGNPFLYGHNGAIIYSTNSFYLPAKDIAVSIISNSQNVNAELTFPYLQEMMAACINFVPTSVEEHFTFKEIQISPNPVSEVVNISYELKNKTSLEIWVNDISGKRLYKLQDVGQGSGSHFIQWSGVQQLEAGLYLIEFVENGRSQSKLFIKK